ncbi:MAG: FixH family protein [Myxococcota bacterium]|nr:FixH family protein [Myxococcota bacterium]
MHHQRATTTFLLLACFACSSGTKDSSDTGPGYDLARSQATDGGSWTVGYTPDPDPIPAAENFSLTLTLDGEAGDDTASGPVVIVDATMPEHEHGMTVVPEVSRQDDGSYLATPLKFHMTGHWEITAEVTHDDQTETAAFHVICCEY